MCGIPAEAGIIMGTLRNWIPVVRGIMEGFSNVAQGFAPAFVSCLCQVVEDKPPHYVEKILLTE